MKNWKSYGIFITVILVLVLICFGVYILVFKSNISEERAIDIAYTYANVKKENVTVLSVNKDNEDREYEIKFYDDTYSYEVDINYNSGRINNFEKDIRNNFDINQNNTILMTEDEAKNIALQKVGKTENEVIFNKVRLDKHSGQTVYYILFYDSLKEYEISVNVDTTEIVSYKENSLNNNNILNNDISNNTNYIGTNKAKDIVLNHVGLSNNQVTFKKVELDVDYDFATYEIEFYYNYFEYEYEIDAFTGKILKYEKDR